MIAQRANALRSRGIWLLLFLMESLPAGPALAQHPPAAPLTAAEVVERMVARNQQRADALKSYVATRVYHLEYHGLKDKTADVVVKMVYQAPDRKEFNVISESGSETLRERVLKRLLKSEVESMNQDNRLRTAIHPDNYEFRLVDYERTPVRDLYVLEATPKSPNKFLFRGRIWVDGKDFAIVRIEGQPAKNPSWWTTRNDFQHSYKKQGEFWLPSRNETITQVRLFGWALLTIEYKDYELTEVESLQAVSPPPSAQTASPPAKRLRANVGLQSLCGT